MYFRREKTIHKFETKTHCSKTVKTERFKFLIGCSLNFGGRRKSQENSSSNLKVSWSAVKLNVTTFIPRINSGVLNN